MNIDKAFKKPLYRVLELLNECIDNCPDELWNKEFAGSIYWRRLYHSLASVWLLLGRQGKHGNNTELYSSTAASLRSEYTNKAPHKDVIRQVSTEAKKHVKLYFSEIDETIIDTEILFQGRVVTLAELLVTSIGHLAYHVGQCNATLMAHGAKSIHTTEFSK